MLPLQPFAAALGLSPEATMAGIENLVQKDLLQFDTNTYEVSIIDWFRFHKFKSPVSLRILESDISKIASETISESVRSRSKAYLPTVEVSNTEIQTQSAENKSKKSKDARIKKDKKEDLTLNEVGVIDMNDRDKVALIRLREKYSDDRIKNAAATLAMPYLSKVADALAKENRDEC